MARLKEMKPFKRHFDYEAPKEAFEYLMSRGVELDEDGWTLVDMAESMWQREFGDHEMYIEWMRGKRRG